MTKVVAFVKAHSLNAQQLTNQLVLLTVGKVLFPLSIRWIELVIVLVAAFAIEMAYQFVFKKDEELKLTLAPLSTGFSIAFMVGSTSIWPYLVGLAIGLGQKNLLKRFFNTHFSNPSNVGIVAALLIFPQYTFSTIDDWGQTVWFAVLVMAIGFGILIRLRLYLLPIIFLACYGLLFYVFISRDLLEVVTEYRTAAFLIFAFFMVTDPKALPEKTSYRVVFCASIALLLVLLKVFLGEKDANMFLALLLASILVPLWRRLETKEVGVLTMTAAGLVLVGLTALYFSPFNIARNALMVPPPIVDSPGASYLDEAMLQPPKSGLAERSLWQKNRAELYKTKWSGSQVVTMPLRAKPAGRLRFSQVPLPPYPNNLAIKEIGDHTALYASVSAGDINHDGYLDIVLAKIGSPLAILINNRKGRFTDATGILFIGKVPTNCENAVLADLNNDSYLDLFIIPSTYFPGKSPRIFLFDKGARRFKEHASFDFNRKSSGGVAMHDLNDDGVLDIYVPYGVNWLSDHIKPELETDPGVFLLSSKGHWQNQIGKYFPKAISQKGYAGMTALFSDFDQDGLVDFFLGNDFNDPSMILRNRDGRLRFVPPDTIENNTELSMSYYTIDFNNDSRFEIWENGAAEDIVAGRLPFLRSEKGQDSDLMHDFRILEKQKEFSNFDCSAPKTKTGQAVCQDFGTLMYAVRGGQLSACQKIRSRSWTRLCRRIARFREQIFSTPSPAEQKYDSETFPRQLRENVLLQLDENSGRFNNVIKSQNAALHTGFSWSAYPFDLNNDGLIDIYIGTGMHIRAHNTNKLLLNLTHGSEIRLEEKGHEAQVAFTDNTRGMVVADFDHDSDGDIVMNNYLTSPILVANQSGGDSIQVELRSKKSNYYGIGSTVRLLTDVGVLTRQMQIGGIWNSYQPHRLHFGIPKKARLQKLEIDWPDKSKSEVLRLKRNHLYVVYE